MIWDFAGFWATFFSTWLSSLTLTHHSLQPKMTAVAADQEQRLRFLGDLLLSSPPGQFDSVLKDVQNILSAASSDLLTTDWIENIRVQYDSSRGAVSAQDDNVPSHPLAAALQDRMKEYVKEAYSPKGVVSTSVVTDGSTPNHVVIRSYSERIDQKNYHAGSWAAEWQIESSGGDPIVMSGRVRLRGQTYEEGRNFYLESNHDLPSTTIQSSNAADDIVKQISTWESNNVLGSLAETHRYMSDSTLKSLRRVMPITRTKMDWNLVNHRAKKMLANNPVSMTK